MISAQVLFAMTVTLIVTTQFLGGIRTASMGPHTARIVMQVIVSLALLGAALYVILSHSYSAEDKHWGFATAGTILGFWLRGPK
jgi:hypothetical protein